MNIGISVENLREAFNHLRNLGKVHTQKDIADIMGSTPSNISKALNGDPKFLTENFLRRFNRAFGGIFNEKWLLGDEKHIPMLLDSINVIRIPIYYREKDQQIQTDGDDRLIQYGYEFLCKTTYPDWDMFRPKIWNLRSKMNSPISLQLMKELWLDFYHSANNGDGHNWQPPEDIIRNFRRGNITNSDTEVSSPSDNSDYVPLLPVEAMAGTLQGFSEGVELAGCQKIKSPVKGADWAIIISGDSMEPDYRNGSYLFIKKISGSFIPWGHTIVLDTHDGVIVKDIYPVEGNDDYIEARSINTKYPPFKIEKSIVIGIYRVLGGTFINSTI